ncbi:hypothetical protein [Streptomyces noursei]|uniref:hypothetical protein n=1 Tax=Streptomyces noursei TaxID=1971 RepID=UPI001679FA59|nr:hypothetical protein [Streptomyces noursei]MCZ1021357.1 hypothetical protein [Streptomyces noursei]GGX51927.1 hypothetical protein GCM10010341_86750 [Streptomyces noursei]
MAKKQTEQLLSDAEIAKWFGVGTAAVGKWRVSQNQATAPGQPRKKPAFEAIAEALKVSLPSGAAVPRSVVVAFGKAVGYLDETGSLIPEIQDKPRRWQPAYPTIDPIRGKSGEVRKRWYAPHLSARYGVSDSAISMWKARDPEFPQAHKDEMGRAFWYDEQLEVWDGVRERREQEKGAGPKPHGYTSDGKPYRHLSSVTDHADGVDSAGRAYQLLPADSYWATVAPNADEAGAVD